MIDNRQELPSESSPDAFDEISRFKIVDSSGISYRDFRKTLVPRYTQVWGELLCGHLALLVTFFLLQITARSLPQLWTLELVVGGLMVGYFYAYIQLFFHEASHYNLARRRSASDFLANIFIGPLTGLDIAQYRKIHFEHHRHLGDTQDPERSYFKHLNIKFFFEALSGKQVLALLQSRSKSGKIAQYDLSTFRGRFQLLLGLTFNGGIVLYLFWHSDIIAGVAWGMGVLVFFPFFTALRQLLEHRDEMARPEIDYSVVAHGKVNRLFGDGPVASTFGGAGFNRHFLHHWDPQLSYTCLRDLERFLANSAFNPSLQKHQTTYAATFLRLFDPRWY